jgi:hypothetical protein
MPVVRSRQLARMTGSPSQSNRLSASNSPRLDPLPTDEATLTKRLAAAIVVAHRNLRMRRRLGSTRTPGITIAVDPELSPR